MFFIVVDAHSKWPEVIETSATTTSYTIIELHKLFAAYGLLKQFVFDKDLCGLCNILQDEWCQAQSVCSVSPIIKWAS